MFKATYPLATQENGSRDEEGNLGEQRSIMERRLPWDTPLAIN